MTSRVVARGALAVLLLASAGCASPNGIVVLMTDYGRHDHYAGVLTANVLRVNPGARIVELTHEIEPYNIAEGAFILAEAAPEFPPGTVFVGVVDPGVGTDRASIVVVTGHGRILVGPDNGLFDPLIRRDGGARAAYRITNPRLMRPGASSSTFHGRDQFAPVAGHLSAGVAPSSVGPPLEVWEPLELAEPARDGPAWRGSVIHVDRYGNVQTNLPARWLQTVPDGGRLVVVAGDGRIVGKHRRTYADVPQGSFVVLANASGRIEVARNQASAAEWLGVKAGDAIRLGPAEPEE